MNQAAATTFGGALQDGSGLQPGLSFTLSAGTLTLTGTNNTYSGNTTINGGILKAGAASTLSQYSNILIGAAGTLDATNFNQAVSSLSVSGALNLTIGNLLGVSNAASFATGSTLNLFGTPVSEELISYSALDPVNNSFTNVTIGGVPLSSTNDTLSYTSSGLYLSAAPSGPATWAVTSGSWSTPSNWSTGPSPAPSGSGATAVLNNATAANVSVTLDVSPMLGKLVMGNADLSSTSGFAITAIGANGLTFNNSGRHVADHGHGRLAVDHGPDHDGRQLEHRAFGRFGADHQREPHREPDRFVGLVERDRRGHAGPHGHEQQLHRRDVCECGRAERDQCRRDTGGGQRDGGSGRDVDLRFAGGRRPDQQPDHGAMVSSAVSSGAAVPAGVDPVPEPGTLALLLAAGLSALFVYRRRKR